jgi:hypothetical protein
MRKVLLLTVCVSVAGCVPHFKEMDSYNGQFRDSYSPGGETTTTPNTGDPYTFSGIAEGSGGLMARQSYATDNQATDIRDDTAKIGEIANDRTPTADSRPGPEMPGTQPAQGTRQSFQPGKPVIVTRGGKPAGP